MNQRQYRLTSSIFRALLAYPHVFERMMFEGYGLKELQNSGASRFYLVKYAWDTWTIVAVLYQNKKGEWLLRSKTSQWRNLFQAIAKTNDYRYVHAKEPIPFPLNHRRHFRRVRSENRSTFMSLMAQIHHAPAGMMRDQRNRSDRSRQSGLQGYQLNQPIITVDQSAGVVDCLCASCRQARGQYNLVETF